jgi:hypothetical protein
MPQSANYTAPQGAGELLKRHRRFDVESLLGNAPSDDQPFPHRRDPYNMKNAGKCERFDWHGITS